MDKTLTKPAFSVLFSVYSREKAIYLSSALKSIWEDQSHKPEEIVIVKDGPLTTELDSVITEFEKVAPVKCLTLDKNYGLGIALAKGLAICSYDIVARMDSDDISRPDRFEKQIQFIADHPEYDIIGSNIAEFNQSEDDIVSFRKVPELSTVICSFAKRRNPMNHMSVMFRKDAVLRAGNYIPFQGYEDYYLWVRMIMTGSLLYNLQDNLVFVRIGKGMIARRQGIFYFKQELKLQKEFYLIGFINLARYMLNILCRAMPRLLPVGLLGYIYKIIRK